MFIERWWLYFKWWFCGIELVFAFLNFSLIFQNLEFDDIFAFRVKEGICWIFVLQGGFFKCYLYIYIFFFFAVWRSKWYKCVGGGGGRWWFFVWGNLMGGSEYAVFECSCSCGGIKKYLKLLLTKNIKVIN